MACPTDQQIFDSLQGKSSATQAEQLWNHAEKCPACRQRVERLEASEHAPLALASFSRVSPGDSSAISVPDACRRMMAAAEKLVSRDEPATAAVANGDHSSHLPFRGRLRGYRILGPIAQGGMGTVYRALHVPLRKRVAIKFLRDHRHLDPRAVGRFHREMQATGLLDHPHIVRALDAGEFQGVPYLVMEFIDGVDVARLLAHYGHLTVADACEIARQTALGLQFAHENNVVHRDVKPSNVMVSRDRQVKLLDLGLARAEPQYEGDLTEDRQILGSADYMAPEQAVAGSRAGPASDIYSLGCMLYHMLAGHPPYAMEATVGWIPRMRAHAESEPLDLDICQPDIPAELNQLVQQMLAKPPEKRPRSAAAVASALESWSDSTRLPMLVNHGFPSDRQHWEVAHVDNLDSDDISGPASLDKNQFPRFRAKVLAVAFVCLSVIGGSFVVPLRTMLGIPSANEHGAHPHSASLIDATAELPIDAEFRWHQHHQAEIRCIALSPDHRFIASAGLDTSVCLWDFPEQQRTTIFCVHDRPIRRLRFSPDSRYLLSLSDDGTIAIFATAERQLVPVAPPLDPAICRDMAYWSDETLLVGLADGLLQFWNWQSGESDDIGRIDGGIEQLSLSPNRDWVAILSEEGKLSIYDLRHRQEMSRALPAFDHPLTCFCWSRVDELIVATTGGLICAIHVPTGTRKQSWQSADESIRDIIRVGGTDVGAVISAATNGTICRWSPGVASPVYRDTRHRQSVNSIICTQDHSYLIAAGAEGRVRMWKIPDDTMAEPFDLLAEYRSRFAKPPHEEPSPSTPVTMEKNPSGGVRLWSSQVVDGQESVTEYVVYGLSSSTYK